jgi:hypothetical protein
MEIGTTYLLYVAFDLERIGTTYLLITYYPTTKVDFPPFLSCLTSSLEYSAIVSRERLHHDVNGTPRLRLSVVVLTDPNPLEIAE